MNLNGNTMLITGGGSGIGRALALKLAERGNTVLICGRRREMLSETAALNANIHGYHCDLTQRDSIALLCEQLRSDGHAVNVLINNAGILSRFRLAESEQFDMDAAEREIDANLTGPVALTAALLPTLLAQPNPAIINVGSPGGIIPVAPFAMYSASKAGLHAYTQVLRLHLQGRAYVAEVFPPTVDTAMTGDLPRKKVSADACAEKILAGLEKGRNEVWVGEGRIVRWLNNLLPPALVFALVNSQPSMKP